jgi:cytochrome c peroxidase
MRLCQLPSLALRHAVAAQALAAALLLPVGAAAAAQGQAATGGAAPAVPFYQLNFSKRPAPAAMSSLGRALFFDPALSASGRMSCSSCHDPAHAYGPPNELPVQPGGADGKQAGLRAVPSLRYLQTAPAFTEHYYEADGNDSQDQGLAGGRTWDGRAASTHEQARLPLFSPQEMANTSVAQVVKKVRAAPYAAQFRDTFGDKLFDDEQLAFKAILMSLEVFQESPADFYPYDSKYDWALRGRAQLSQQELNGLALFNDPRKGNCAACHPSAIKEGGFPQFTDYGYGVLGLPRNPKIPANADPAYHDLGVCGPFRKDLADRKEYCGMFKVPSLRNAALRGAYFHNGAAHSLRDAIAFYVQRDTRPEKWYPRDTDGTVRNFDDLPEAYRGNVNMEPPFGGKPGDAPALSDEEIDSLVAFLRTLTDGYRPQAASN